jgi:acetyl esterase/lipase
VKPKPCDGLEPSTASLPIVQAFSGCREIAGMPPALFTVGDLDPLRDETILMAQRWLLAGSRADLDVWPEGAHAFANMATPLGDLALERTTGWLTSILEARKKT